MKYNKNRGEMAEWLKAPTLKVGVEITTEGSNPSLSLKISNKLKKSLQTQEKTNCERYINCITYY